jgi:hypothetical protein
MQLGLSSAGVIDNKTPICYNNNMTTITINDPSKATDAGEWCSNNIRPKDWGLSVRNLFTSSTHYDFSFKDSKQAVEFALRWI